MTSIVPGNGVFNGSQHPLLTGIGIPPVASSCERESGGRMEKAAWRSGLLFRSASTAAVISILGCALCGDEFSIRVLRITAWGPSSARIWEKAVSMLAAPNFLMISPCLRAGRQRFFDILSAFGALYEQALCRPVRTWNGSNTVLRFNALRDGAIIVSRLAQSGGEDYSCTVARIFRLDRLASGLSVHPGGVTFRGRISEFLP